MPRQELNSVFFGGGTPSLMPPETVAAVLARAARHWPFAADIEITLEANPTSVEASRFAAFRAAGVNRVSLGVQALDDAALRFLGRQHSAAEACAALALARRYFPRHSFDLIYGRPSQRATDWRAELARALDLTGDHVSLYQLTIEKGTPFYAGWRRGDFLLPDDELGAALYETTQELLAAAGRPAYEISNHAAAGGECRHNLIYWRYGEYLGIGPGAHGRLGIGESRRATRQLRQPESWLAAVEARGHGSEAVEPLTADDRANEMLMLGLRLSEGVSLAAFSAEVGRPLAAAVDAERLAELCADGFLRLDAERLSATAAGRPVLNTLLARLLS